MLGEGVVVFFVAKAFSHEPSAALAAAEDSNAPPSAETADQAPTALAEIGLADCRTFNKESGRLIAFHIRVSVLVAAKDADHVKNLIAAKQARIDDRVNTVIRSAEPKQLNEPGLETIKRRLKHECSRIFENETLVHEILIPHLVQSGPGV
jgi:flagellar basal body-associated protein FliL